MSHASSSSQPEPEPEPQPNAPRDVIQLRFDQDGFPIGLGSEKAPSKLGRLVRTQVSIRYKTWFDVPGTVKDGVWEDMKVLLYTLKFIWNDLSYLD